MEIGPVKGIKVEERERMKNRLSVTIPREYSI
jgi:hypothetical protein